LGRRDVHHGGWACHLCLVLHCGLAVVGVTLRPNSNNWLGGRRHRAPLHSVSCPSCLRVFRFMKCARTHALAFSRFDSRMLGRCG
jgi:hypothetical protein